MMRYARPKGASDDEFLCRLEAAELRDRSKCADPAFETPARPKRRDVCDITPPHAPAVKLRPRSRLEHAKEFLSRSAKSATASALAAWHAPQELLASAGQLARSAKVSVLKRSRRKKHTLVAAVDDGQLPRAATVAPTLTRPNTRAAAHAVAAAAATLTTAAVTSKPTRAKRAVRKAPLVTSDAHPSTGASLTGFANTALINLPPSAVPSIDLPPPRRMSTRRASADPLVRHGYAMQGPIAAGAFSTIVRAKEVASGHEVFPAPPCQPGPSFRTTQQVLGDAM